jgi:hypothetical protein
MTARKPQPKFGYRPKQHCAFLTPLKGLIYARWSDGVEVVVNPESEKVEAEADHG